jgi:hypothetical protein
MPTPDLASPDWLLAGFDADRRLYHLAQVSRSTYRQTAFLDHRIHPMPTATLSVDEAQLDATLRQLTGPRSAWIFHTGFCCSTLLASCLDHPETTLVLREPMVLSRLAQLKRDQQETPAGQKLIFNVLAMCERSYPGEAVLIKPSNFANALLPALANNPASTSERKVVLMSSGLDSLLVSMMKKKAEAEATLPGFVRSLLKDSDYQQRTDIHDVGALSLLQQSVVFWHCQRYFLQNYIAAALPGSFMTLSMERFLAEPEVVLGETSHFLDLGLADSVLQETVRSGAFTRHSKQQQKKYNPQAHQLEQRETVKQFRMEILQALDWAQPLLEKLPVRAFDAFEEGSSIGTAET